MAERVTVGFWQEGGIDSANTHAAHYAEYCELAPDDAGHAHRLGG